MMYKLYSMQGLAGGGNIAECAEFDEFNLRNIAIFS